VNYDDFADLYDHQYDTYRDDLQFYARLADEARGPVLEVGAGTGRVTAFLARRGARVTGLEPSGRMLQRARERTRGLGCAFVQGDVRTARLPDRYALVIIPFNALMHLYTPEDQEQALRNVHAHLQPRGVLAFDLSAPPASASRTVQSVGETFHTRDGRTDVLLTQQHERARQMLVTHYLADTSLPDGRVRRRHVTLTQRYYTRAEVEWLLHATGFAPPHVMGDFQGTPLTERSETMVFRTQRT